MRSFLSCGAVWTFLSRHRLELIMLLLALAAVGGLCCWWLPPQPRASWQVVNAGAGCSLTPDGRILFGISQREIKTQNGSRTEWPVGPVRLWDAATGKERLRILGDGDYLLSSVRVSPDSRWLAVADRQGGLAVWDLTTGRQHAVLTPRLEGYMALFGELRFSPDSRLLAQERANGKGVVLWDIAAAHLRADLEDARHPFEFSPDGRTVAVQAFYYEPLSRTRGGWQGVFDYLFSRTYGHPRVPAVKLFEVTTGRQLGEVPGSWWGTFTPDGRTFFTAVRTDHPPDAPLVVHRWDLPLGRPAGLYVSLSALLLFVIVGCLRPLLYFLYPCRFRRLNSTTASACSSVSIDPGRSRRT